MTIGRPQGATWIGKPLDLVIPLALENTEKGDGLCLEAEVVQGDARIDDRRVTVSLEPGSSAGGSRLHVRSTVAIEEPVVNVTVRAGCDTRSIRTYVLLADVPPEAVSLPRTAPSASRADGGAPAFAPQERSTRSSRGNAGAGSAAIGSGGTARRSAPLRSRSAESGERAAGTPPPAPRRAVVAQAPARVAPAVRVPVPAAPAARVTAPEPQRETVATGSRLQVDALEPLSLREAGLKTSPSLALPGSEDLAMRAQAAAQWRALSAPPEDAQREAQRIQSLEATLAALREQTAQNQRTLLEMRSELAEARDSRYNNPLVYALGLLLLLALVAIALLWRLSRRAVAPAWWGDGPDAREGGPRPGPTPDSQFDDLVEHPTTQPDALPPGVLDPRHAALLASTNADTRYDHDAAEPAATRAPEPAAVRPVNTEELFDVQ
ncbi:MAG: hypothetical protein ABIQ82_02320, partial [Variovorax sp.]